MPTRYHSLPTTRLPQGASYHRPRHTLPSQLNLDSPATQAMTDLSKVYAVTINPNASIDDANQKMIANAIRLLLVVNPQDEIKGIVTASDVLGEKPVLHMRKTGVVRSEIRVQDIMTPQEHLQVIQMVDVNNARVGDIVENLLRDGRQHALVADIDEATMQETVRGIFSLASIAKQVGCTFEPRQMATTFAELGQVLTT